MGLAPYDRLLPLGERPTQLRQGDILQLPYPLSGHSEFLADFFESFRFTTVQPESHQDNFALAVVQHFQKLAKFVALFLSLNDSNGVCASSSPTISPNAVESSSLIGASRDAGRIETLFN